MIEATYTPDDLAARFGVPRRRILEWNALYAWPHTRIGRHIYWTETQLSAVLRKHHIAAGMVSTTDGRTKGSRARSAS